MNSELFSVMFTWMFPKIGVPQNGWFISWKTLLKWMIWGYHYFWKHPHLLLRALTLTRTTGCQKTGLLIVPLVKLAMAKTAGAVPVCIINLVERDSPSFLDRMKGKVAIDFYCKKV